MVVMPTSTRGLIKKIVLGFAAFVGTAVAVPLVGQFFISLAEEWGLYKQPSARLAVVIAWLADLTSQSWFHWIGGILIGFAAGVWLDALMKRREVTLLVPEIDERKLVPEVQELTSDVSAPVASVTLSEALPSLPAPSVVPAVALEPQKPQPPKRYYSPTQKGQIADGLQALRVSLKTFEVNLKDKTVKTVTVFSSFIIPGRGNTARYRMNDEVISGLFSTLQDFDGFMQGMANGPASEVTFLSDPNYRQEAAFLLQSQDYSLAQATVAGHVSWLLITMQKLKGIWDRTHDTASAEEFMSAVRLEKEPFSNVVRSFSRATQPLEQWISDTQARAGELEKSLQH